MAGDEDEGDVVVVVVAVAVVVDDTVGVVEVIVASFELISFVGGLAGFPVALLSLKGSGCLDKSMGGRIAAGAAVCGLLFLLCLCPHWDECKWSKYSGYEE